MVLRMRQVSPSMTTPTPTPADDLQLRKQLLKVVLRDTVRSNGVPGAWIAGETKLAVQPTGETMMELQLSVECDEPRFLTYLTAFQADFNRRLLAIEPGAGEWFSALTWRLRNEPKFEVSMPAPIFWDKVSRDREDKPQVAEPPPLPPRVDFAKTLPTPRRAEDLAKD
jgi:hypothetical protein